MSGLRVGSLFAGVGGFDMGLEQAGFEVCWQVEIDKDAVSVLERHYPNVRRYRDVCEVDPAELAPVDVVTFGSPCQDFSVAGKRAGLEGERSGLFGEAIRIIGGLRPAPAFCVWENVPGALSSAGGRDFGTALDALAGIGALDIAWRVLDARHFGVPQRRRRIFLVADFGAERAAQILFESASGGGDLEACGEAGEGVAGDVEDGTGVVGEPVVYQCQGNNVGAIGTLRQGNGGLTGGVPFVASTTGQGWWNEGPGTLRADAGGMEQSGHLVIANSVTASAGHHGHSSPRGDGSDNIVAVAFDWQKGGGGNDHSWRGKSREWIERAGDYAGSLSATKHDAVAFHMTQDPINGAESRALGAGNEAGCSSIAVATFHEAQITSKANRTRVEYGRPSDTLNGDPRINDVDARAGMAVRRLTPRECERLMGWPDDRTRYRADGSEIPDGPRYRMIGNGVVAPVARWIGARLRHALEGGAVVRPTVPPSLPSSGGRTHE